jgi:hypothetical protein
LPSGWFVLDDDIVPTQSARHEREERHSCWLKRKSTRMDQPIPEEKLIDIRGAIFGGRKIEAIKLNREATDVELVDAKKAVEALEKELRATSPTKFTTPPSRKGCLGVIVLVGVVVAALLWLVSR